MGRADRASPSAGPMTGAGPLSNNDSFNNDSSNRLLSDNDSSASGGVRIIG